MRTVPPLRFSRASVLSRVRLPPRVSTLSRPAPFTSTEENIVPERDDSLRGDIHLLGELLGQVLRESGDLSLYDDVERLRALTISAHESNQDDELAEAEAFVAALSPQRAEEVARAFTCYFHLVNAAEEFHRVRVLRRRETEAGTPSPEDSIVASIRALTAELGEEEALTRLSQLEFRPVLTAHPTEARRRAVASTIRRISELLEQHDDPRIGGVVVVEIRRRLLAEIDTLWRTAPLRESKPTPMDEVRTAMSVFDESLFSVLPRVYRRLDDALLNDASGTRAPVAPAFVRLGSWIGGDRDGNPFVTAETTLEAVNIASEHVLIGLERVARRVGRALTLDTSTTPPSVAATALWVSCTERAPEIAAEIAERSPNETHRRILLFAAERLAATRSQEALGYTSAAELLTELQTLQESLLAAGDTRAAYGDLQDFIWQLETFGFHLAEMEVRQHSSVHRKTIDALHTGGELDERSLEVLSVFRAIGHIQKRFGTRAARRYIISFTQSADDVRTVFELAEAATDGHPPVIDAIPLFETFADLNASTDVLAEMIRLPQVKARLHETGHRLEVMLGYSDSSKDVGPVSATLALHDAQTRIAAWAKAEGIVLTLFHGRGGALGRGGGPANRAVLAQPPGSVEGRFKLTEQGEVIFARYGNPAIATRHIEQVAGATLLASSPSVGQRNADAAQRFANVAAIMDRESRRQFFALVKAEGFAAWFARVTPQDEVGLLALGSRPARRGLSLESLEDLRAIPWVFAWTQARINLTGWFGLGSALKTIGDVGLLRSAYASWPLFTTMIDNVEMSLAKTDEGIARRYLALDSRDDLADLVLDEMALTRHWVLSITGEESLLKGHQVLGRAVRLRTPYVNALSLLQLRALRALRTSPGSSGAEHNQRLLLLAVNGVAAGLQNTG
ncbi:phosphoenolpyruvate carboxylase [Rathayibacter toxicus]|uniref:phosphoenolpyruvate carboxylase n=1 Tax=Rathayibacter toxicus TaxID=145458 RepID=UPI0009E53CDF|nr:phosphoenolpyruvate carboxylase [Rathayibacter toxicus]PPG46499.1 phosphoenolpyruvate carboxylase [Rathayibacter toxicus]PPH63384.1 phosphoenolpyruvate carboxylase [Rathayibacter toxicus]PPH67726.1 phosphoenolpyruvate carboxylase [Rathayibacter toxicus]PPH72528.1 phosphoenolpyruvate carboxylase [Rathayibacter toxicus]